MTSTKNQLTSNNSSFHFLRLLPNQDVRQTLIEYCGKNQITAASIISAVGSLKIVKLRKANSDGYYESQETHEILTLSGLLSSEGLHIHMSLSDKEARVYGGHLSEGNIVFTTLELVIAEYHQVRFDRERDPQTGYIELKLNPIQS